MKQMRQWAYLAIRRKMGSQQNGFVFLLVVMVIALIGAEMFVLTGLTNTMLFETNTAYLGAFERNLTASGLAWAERNVKSRSREAFNKTIELDVTSMNIHSSTLTVTIGMPTDKGAEVQINTSCSRGRRSFRQNNKYRIEL